MGSSFPSALINLTSSSIPPWKTSTREPALGEFCFCLIPHQRTADSVSFYSTQLPRNHQIRNCSSPPQCWNLLHSDCIPHQRCCRIPPGFQACTLSQPHVGSLGLVAAGACTCAQSPQLHLLPAEFDPAAGPGNICDYFCTAFLIPDLAIFLSDDVRISWFRSGCGSMSPACKHL